MRKLAIFGGVLAVLLLAAAGGGVWLFYFSPYKAYARNALPVGNGVSAELACGGVFVSHRKLDEVVREDVHRLSPLTRWNRFELDEKAKSVTVSLFGMGKRTAFYRSGIGCTLLVNATPEALRKQAQGIVVPDHAPRPDPWPKGDAVDLSNLPAGVNGAALERAVADAFLDDTPDHDIDTRAIVVVYDGRIVAERYAPGFDKDMPLLGWSASKSVTATLIGTLIQDGKLDLEAPPPVPEWKWPGDPRSQITLREMLNMSSGLAFEEPYDPGSDSTQMLFQQSDMGAFAAAKPLGHPPGTFWSYSSGTANILSRLVFQKAGGSLRAYEAYAQAHLFGPAGMASAMFEPDESGSFIGSSFLYMSARDWARLGQLYLDGGKINGVQIVPASFADFVARPAPADASHGYGGHFWLNGYSKDGRQFPHLPKDFFAAEGHNDEHIGIFPSRRAVIVRLGWTVLDGGFDLDKHFAAILAALPVLATPPIPKAEPLPNDDETMDPDRNKPDRTDADKADKKE